MLIRLKVDGFKNLVGVDIPFGPFTCIAGPNAAGKSNLFDAIIFLSALADRPLLDAAASVRSQVGPGGDVRRLFHHVGDDYADEMTFEAEMIVPVDAVDDLGQVAKASITFLRYKLVLGYRRDDPSAGGLEVRCEELQHIVRKNARRHIKIPARPSWVDSVLRGRRSGQYFISTAARDSTVFVQIHQDRGTGGRNRQLPAKQLPRTVLSTTNAAETPTALVARRELQSWRLLQLEPTALRAPDPYRAPHRIDANGGHMPATLARLARTARRAKGNGEVSTYAVVANRLAELTEGVKSIRVDEDDRRELLTVVVTDLQGTEHEARALSDGTLRFLALAILAEDPEALGLVCLEEPENGIHPERIPAMLRILQDLSVGITERVGSGNPLRQVIVNTHSPAVVSLVPEDSLVFVKTEPCTLRNKKIVQAAAFRWLKGTWRDSLILGRDLAKGDLLAYLNPAALTRIQVPRGSKPGPGGRRVIDRPDVRQLALPTPSSVS